LNKMMKLDCQFRPDIAPPLELHRLICFKVHLSFDSETTASFHLNLCINLRQGHVADMPLQFFFPLEQDDETRLSISP